MYQSECNSSYSRAESPSITTSTTTQSVSSTSNHSTTVLCNGQYNNGYKGNNCNEQQNKFRICRDFVRGSCRRLLCKYPHVTSPDLVVFCHDFQNNKCPRLNCKFLHYTIDDEEHYRKYGEFPIIGQQDDFSNNQNMNNVNNSGNNHDYSGDYEYNNKGYFSNNSNSSNGNRSLPSILDTEMFHHCQQRIEGGCSHSLRCHNNDRGFSNVSNSFRNSLKRLSSQDQDFMQQQESKFKRCREDDIMVVLRRFEEEHQMLKRRVEANELKIAELRASNEYLMTQNAQLRISTVQVSRVVNPVTVTHTQAQQQQAQTQVISASMAPVQNPQVLSAPIVSMAAPQTQIITTPPNVPPIVGTIHATANTSQQTQQILGTSQITLSPAVPSIGLSINTSQALQAAISNASQPIISYPIMTHSILPH
ncbi:unnamed protein product [Chironomus riparius]|uniref:C3H1-type domain-containing protein n=1 Tax=Chironomus riparius TaxID=315576 RepID=A0A9N9RPN1_9DIPT|nr:unnamed protein product [Chironomus riparius]